MAYDQTTKELFTDKYSAALKREGQPRTLNPNVDLDLAPDDPARTKTAPELNQIKITEP